MEIFKVRSAKEKDMDDVMSMIQELADFEKMSDGPKITAEILKKDCFQSVPPLFQCAVVESKKDLKIVGYAIFFNVYSTWEGKSLMLEDIYVKPSCRKNGVGKMLFSHVAKIALETSCCRLDFHVLSWNPAIKFYEKCGAKDITKAEQWHFYRFLKDDMKELVSSTDCKVCVT